MKNIYIKKVRINKAEIAKAKIDSLLCNSNTTLCSMNYILKDDNDIIEDNNTISAIVAGEVKIEFENQTYCFPEDFPEDLVGIIKSGIDSDGRVLLLNNNWIEIFGSDIDTGEIIDGKFNNFLDIIKLLIVELIHLYNINLDNINFADINDWEFL